MGDTMLHAVLNMPSMLWREDAIDEAQRQARYMEASARIIRLEGELSESERKLELAVSALTRIADGNMVEDDWDEEANDALMEIGVRTSNPAGQAVPHENARKD